MDTCIYCERVIVFTDNGEWADMAATGDDLIWRYVCDENDTFEGEHKAGAA